MRGLHAAVPFLYYPMDVFRHSAERIAAAFNYGLEIFECRLHRTRDNANADAPLQKAQSVTLLGMGKNILLTGMKGVIGVASNSHALIADAAHSLSDILVDLVAMATLHMASLPSSELHPYGYGKYEPVGALCISGLLISAGASLVWNSVGLVQTMLVSTAAPIVPGMAALWISFSDIGLNEFLFHITLRAGKKAHSQTVVANAWHHRSDSLSSLVAMVGISLAMAGFPMLDPIAGGLVGALMAKTGGKIFKDSMKDLTDTRSDKKMMSTLEAILLNVTDVIDCKSLRHRRMGDSYAVDAHVCVIHGLSISETEKVAEAARAAVQQELPQVTEIMVHTCSFIHEDTDGDGPAVVPSVAEVDVYTEQIEAIRSSNIMQHINGEEETGGGAWKRVASAVEDAHYHSV